MRSERFRSSSLFVEAGENRKRKEGRLSPLTSEEDPRREKKEVDGAVEEEEVVVTARAIAEGNLS